MGGPNCPASVGSYIVAGCIFPILVTCLLFAIGRDGDNCFVSSDALWVSTTEVEGVDTTNIAALWRIFFLLATILHFAFFGLFLASGITICCADVEAGLKL